GHALPGDAATHSVVAAGGILMSDAMWRTHSCVPCRDSSRRMGRASTRVWTRHAGVRAPQLKLLALAILCSIPAWAATLEQPVGLVLTSDGLKLLRQGANLPLEARPGDLLFTGDTLQAGSGTATFLFCPDKTWQRAGAGSVVVMDVRSLRFTAAEKRPAAVCL